MTRERFYDDVDPIETQEWIDALDSLLENAGPERAKYLLDRLSERARTHGVQLTELTTPYVNTIPVDQQANFPGDLYLERRIRSLCQTACRPSPITGTSRPAIPRRGIRAPTTRQRAHGIT